MHGKDPTCFLACVVKYTKPDIYHFSHFYYFNVILEKYFSIEMKFM